MLAVKFLRRFGVAMRIIVAPMAVLYLIAGAAAAGAETKIFIIENQRDGYGIDQCLASGASCGQPVASAYCHSRNYDQAVSFRKIEANKIADGVATEASCRSGGCNQYVAIECTR